MCKRIKKIVKDKTIHYIWSGYVLLHEVLKTNDNEQVITWVYEQGSFVPTAKLIDGEAYSIVSDYLGTPIRAYDEEGNLVWERELDIYGKVKTETRESANFVPFRYQGQYYDSEIDLCYNRFRYYDCNIGTYISQDPIGLAGGLAFYAYVHDVNSWVDVFGLNEINDLGKIGEYNAGITKNTIRIPSISGKKEYRIPDSMSKNQRHIIEVKNVNYQHFSSQ